MINPNEIMNQLSVGTANRVFVGTAALGCPAERSSAFADTKRERGEIQSAKSAARRLTPAARRPRCTP